MRGRLQTADLGKALYTFQFSSRLLDPLLGTVIFSCKIPGKLKNVNLCDIKRTHAMKQWYAISCDVMGYIANRVTCPPPPARGPLIQGEGAKKCKWNIEKYDAKQCKKMQKM